MHNALNLLKYLAIVVFALSGFARQTGTNAPLEASSSQAKQAHHIRSQTADSASSALKKKAKKKKKKKKCLDTDRDYLCNRQEVSKFGTDPNKKDTDGNGVADGNEDFDNDGIDNEDENDRPGEGSKAEDRDDDPSDRPPTTKPTATPTKGPTKSPTKTPTPSPGGNSCDAGGNTSGFGIPSGLTGNKSTGSSTWSAQCRSCHGASFGSRSFSQIKGAMSNSAMSFLHLSDGSIAHVTAYLNCH